MRSVSSASSWVVTTLAATYLELSSCVSRWPTSVVFPAPTSPGDDDESLSLQQPEIQVGKRLLVGLAAEEEPVIRAQLKRRPGQLVVLGEHKTRSRIP
jgi:hypothetical protein